MQGVYPSDARIRQFRWQMTDDFDVGILFYCNNYIHFCLVCQLFLFLLFLPALR